MAVTLKDIARECGLAVSTVSNILNNNSTSFASEEVRVKVRRTAETLGYKKDYLSSSLRTRTTKSIGLVLDQIDEHTRQDFLVPFVEEFSRRGYEIALTEHRFDPERAIAALTGFRERCKDGIVLFTDLLGRPQPDQDRLKGAIEASGQRILGIGSRLRGTVPSLDIDRGHAADRSVGHFLAQGHRNILVAYEYEWDLRPRFAYWDHPGLTFWEGIHTPADFSSRVASEGLGKNTAIFFRTDKVAIPALNLFRARGLRVPQDLEVISFDNFPFTEHTVPALSTWDIGFHRLGIRAQELLAGWIAGTGPATDFYESFLPDFVPRESHGGAL